MKVLLMFVCVTAIFAAPQGIEEEAEVVPRRTVPGEVDGGDRRLFVIPLWNPFRRVLFDMFGGRRGSDDDTVTDISPEEPQRSDRGGFTNFIKSIFRLAHTPPQDATITFQNSTIEVIDIGGVPVRVNKTIVEHTGEDGSVYRRVQQVFLDRSNETFPTEVTDFSSSFLPPAEDEANEVEIGTSSPHHSVQKRFVITWARNALRKHQGASRPPRNYLPGDKPDSKEAEEERVNANSHTLNPVSYVGDTDVNYLGGSSRFLNPDAEVFDADLMRDSERKFWERRGGSVAPPMMSQPLRAEPMMFQPLRSQPLMSQPPRRQPVMSQPLRTQPLMSQPPRRQPVMSQPLRRQPVMSYPIRSEARMSQPYRRAYVRL